MPLRNARPLTLRLRSLSDAVDGTNAFPGSMAILSNLIPAPHTTDQWICRPAATMTTDFTGFAGAGQVELMFRQGSRIFGLIATTRNPGNSEPFIYDLSIAAFVTVTGITAANTPVQQPTTGDWVPCTADTVGARVMVTSPGFSLPNAFGWFDMTGFTDSGLTGTTHTSTLVDGFVQSVLARGWRPGMIVTNNAANIPAGTRILSIASNGLSVTLSAATTSNVAGAIFTVVGGTYAAPLWCAGNLNENPLVAVATAVAQYAGSACYAVNTTSPPSAAISFSDPGDPLRQTNVAGNQVTTFENAQPVTALKGMPQTNITGGIVQSLIAFQGDANIQQITGTPATLSLAVNSLNDTVGTLAPSSIAVTPLGMMFIAPDGLRVITFGGTISDVIGEAGQGVATPFIYAQNPSRICAAYNEDVYRVTVTSPQTPLGSPTGTITTREYWFHLGLKKWSGPHTSQASLILATATPHGFLMVPSGMNAVLYSSNALPNSGALYIEYGTQLAFVASTSLFPDTGVMAENEIIEAAIGACITGDQPLTVSMQNENGTLLDQVQVVGVAVGSALWGVAIWGQFAWGGGTGPFRQYQAEWHAPLIFHQGVMTISGNSASGIVLGNIYLRYQILRYLLQGTQSYA